MKAIYKYRIPFQEVAKVTLPEGSTIIRIEGLDGAIWCWAIVDTNNPLEERTFHLFKTGGEMPDNIHEATYLGCGAIHIQMELMMYIFEYPNTAKPVDSQPNIPFDWKLHQEGDNHAI